LKNLNSAIHPWLIIGRYWPVLIIFWGLSRLISHFRLDQDSATRRRSVLTAGDIVLLLFLLVLGTAITKAVSINFGDLPQEILDLKTDEPFDIFGVPSKSFSYVEERTQPLTNQDTTLDIQNLYGNVDIDVHDHAELRIRLERKIKSQDESKAKALASGLTIVVQHKSSGYSVTTNRNQQNKENGNEIKTNFSIWVPRATRLVVSNKYGSITLKGVAGPHSLINGYGAIKVSDIEGNLHIENQNGPVKANEVSGNCDVNNKYGPVELDTIGGTVKIDESYGSLTLRNIKGPVQLAQKYGSVNCSDLESTLSIDGRYAEIKGASIEGDVQIVTSYKDVDLEDVRGAVTVQGKHGDISIKGEHTLTKPIKVDSEYSAVSITLPEESRFRIEAYSKFGKFVSDFESISGAEFSSESGKDAKIKGSHGEGGPLITINTSYRDISLNAS
jgi:hypothetical protein